MNELVKKISEILELSLGKYITEAMIENNCRRIGSALDSLNLLQLPEFIERLRPTLLFFCDKEKIKEIIEKIEKLKEG